MILSRSDIKDLTGYVRTSARWFRRDNGGGMVWVRRFGLNVSLIFPMDQLRGMSGEGRCAGVYFLWAGPQLIYVGQSSYIINRISQHIDAEQIPFDWATYIAVKDDMRRDDVEEMYIRIHVPPFNRDIP